MDMRLLLALKNNNKILSLWTGLTHNSCVAWAQTQYVWKQKAALGAIWYVVKIQPICSGDTKQWTHHLSYLLSEILAFESFSHRHEV